MTVAAPYRELLDLQGVHKEFPIRTGLLGRTSAGAVQAVDGVDVSIQEASTYGLVGESGCGKTTLAKLILRIEEPDSGLIRFDGLDVHNLKGDDLRTYKRAVQVVFQDPYSSLNPRMKVSEIIEEPLLTDPASTAAARTDRINDLLDLVRLPSLSAGLYPHQFSGGQRQRIAIARALAPSPRFIVLDEPVSSLDVSIRAQIMNLLKDLQNQLDLTYLLISHDLAGIRYLSDQIGVMYLGKIVETGPVASVYSKPLHPYTEALLSNAMPSHPRDPRNEIILPGEVPSPIDIPSGCRFHPRCPYAWERCAQEQPQLQEIAPGHRAACHLHDGTQGATLSGGIDEATDHQSAGDAVVPHHLPSEEGGGPSVRVGPGGV